MIANKTSVTPSSSVIDLAGQVHYRDFGGGGRALVLVHGLGGSCENWGAVGPQLTGLGHTLAVDLAGFGRTPLSDQRLTTVEANVELLDRFIDEVVGVPVTLIGHSMGAMISILEAAAEPDKVEALVLIDASLPHAEGAPIDPVVAMVFGTYLTEEAEDTVRAYLDANGPEGSWNAFVSLCAAEPDKIAAEHKDAYIALTTERMEMEWAARAQVEAARSLLGLNMDPDRYFGEVAKVKAPTLIVHGELDRLIPLESARALAARRPDWKLEVFDGVGHLPPYEAPDRLVATISKFLEDTAAQ